jgi:hypothetical protein
MALKGLRQAEGAASVALMERQCALKESRGHRYLFVTLRNLRLSQVRRAAHNAQALVSGGSYDSLELGLRLTRVKPQRVCAHRAASWTIGPDSLAAKESSISKIPKSPHSSSHRGGNLRR